MSISNESAADRVIRVVLGLVILYLGFGGVVSGGFGLFLKIFGFIPLLTGLVGFCPLYRLFNFRTNKKSA